MFEYSIWSVTKKKQNKTKKTHHIWEQSGSGSALVKEPELKMSN